MARFHEIGRRVTEVGERMRRQRRHQRGRIAAAGVGNTADHPKLSLVLPGAAGEHGLRRM
jgi:hypothetical protein